MSDTSRQTERKPRGMDDSTDYDLDGPVNACGGAGRMYQAVSNSRITKCSKAELKHMVRTGRLSAVRYRIEMRRRANADFFDFHPSPDVPCLSPCFR